ncbi:Hypothetical protein A7982_05221 [Minicystis rosea]|nr:Hypothetical protein A7982_05221 [Minicystis rosea]
MLSLRLRVRGHGRERISAGCTVVQLDFLGDVEALARARGDRYSRRPCRPKDRATTT